LSPKHAVLGLNNCGHSGEREFTLARTKIGDLMKRLELTTHLIDRRGFAGEWKKHTRPGSA
jgi:hypothetical protein